MKYQDCLDECIEDCTQHTNINKRSKNAIVKFYCGYPIPNEKLWAMLISEGNDPQEIYTVFYKLNTLLNKRCAYLFVYLKYKFKKI